MSIPKWTQKRALANIPDIQPKKAKKPVAKSKATLEEVLGDAVAPETTFKEVVEGVASIDPYIWTMLNRRLKGLKTVFNIATRLREIEAQGLEPSIRDLIRHRPFLIQPLRDQSKHKTYEKGRQVGVSELVLTEELWFLSQHPNTKWVHTFPREKQLIDFSNTRIIEALNESPMMQRLIGIPNQTFTKRIMQSFLFLRSAWESDLGEGIDADGVVFDEKDRMKDGIEYAFQESLSASPYGLLRDVSTPTIPGRGVDLSYEKSDKKWWLVACRSCGEVQPTTFDNIHQVNDCPPDLPMYPPDTFEYLCKKAKCRGVLDRMCLDRAGQWVPLHPERKHGVSGYWISQLMAPWITATEVMQKKRDYKFRSLFENYVLGIASLGDSLLLQARDFQEIQVDYKWPIPYRTQDFVGVSVGIDWGGSNWVVIIGKNRHNGINYLLNAFWIDDTNIPLESAKDIIHAIMPYNPDIIVGDAGYGKDRNELIYRSYPDQTYFCQYNPASQKRATSLNPSWSDNLRKCLCDKTLTIKITCREMRMGSFGIPVVAEHPQVQMWINHFLNLAPIKHEEDGEVWEEMSRKGPDHFAQATNYALLGQAYALQENTFDFGFF
ncbi:phage terminase large subunit family protein [Patescibacteria group bacterium]|nr:phage terminase large subunit family protein [Patescibacteria group bacterium]